MAIGGLMIRWASTESVFLVILKHLIGRDDLSAAIIWHSFRGNSKARLDLITRLSREQISNPTLRKEVKAACDQFAGFSGVRNFYAHSVFRHAPDGKISEVHGVELTYDDDPVRITNKPMTRATLNEITDTTRKLVKFSRTTWDLADKIADALGVPREPRPV